MTLFGLAAMNLNRKTLFSILAIVDFGHRYKKNINRSKADNKNQNDQRHLSLPLVLFFIVSPCFTSFLRSREKKFIRLTDKSLHSTVIMVIGN